MNDLIWSWLLTIVGATCFYLAGGLNGRKVWWAWYIGLFAQVLWATYAFLDLEHRMGFLVGVVLYGFVYVRNCINWTREHRAEAAIRKLQRQGGAGDSGAALLVPTGWHVPADKFYSPYGSTPEEHNAAVEEMARERAEGFEAAWDEARPRRGGPKFTKGPSTEEPGA